MMRVGLGLALVGGAAAQCSSQTVSISDALFTQRVVVTNEAKGARCAVAADFDGDGKMDLISASSTDNTVAWYRNEGGGSWSTKKDITYVSNGARIVTVGDVDSDGDVDAIAASYYDNTIRWFENDGTGKFTSTHIITQSAVNAQGVVAADLDGDGDLDLASASSGDNTVAVFTNLDKGRFCEVKHIVDDNAIGVRTVVAADLDGDGDLDLASASKDDNTVAWYPNDGNAKFTSKIVISSTSMGAYSLVARDVEGDGDMDLIVASNGDDTVALWRNDGTGQFTKVVIYENADFVLSVTAFDFDRDGDIDVASASYFDGYVRWYENLDGNGGSWQNHTLYVGSQGHYVSTADLDDDGDEDLISVTKSENRVQIFYAATPCDGGNVSAACCRQGQSWNAATSACEECAVGTYGTIDSGSLAQCTACSSGCKISGLVLTPPTCYAVTGCPDVAADVKACDCGVDTYKSNSTDTCVACPAGQSKAAGVDRTSASLSETTLWPGLLNTCSVQEGVKPLVIWLPIVCVLVAAAVAFGLYKSYVRIKKAIVAQEAYEAALNDKVEEAMVKINELGFSMCFVSLANIKSMSGAMWSHERTRDAGFLKFLDTYDELITFVKDHPTAFFSHQWLAIDSPDPTGVHLRAIVDAAETLCTRDQIDPATLYCWVDYMSIPQMNPSVKVQSISSIGIYSSVCRYFVAVCPPTTHQDTGLACDVTSYQARGWCRLEQWARLTTGGLKRMFIYDGAKMIELAKDENLLADSIKVFNGNFSDPRDKAKLVPTILGLWATVLRNQRLNNDTAGSYELVKQNYEQVFPSEYFAELLPRIEAAVEDEDYGGLSARSDYSNTTAVTVSSDAGRYTRGKMKRSRTMGFKDSALFKAFKAGQGDATPTFKPSRNSRASKGDVSPVKIKMPTSLNA